MSGYKKA